MIAIMCFVGGLIDWVICLCREETASVSCHFSSTMKITVRLLFLIFLASLRWSPNKTPPIPLQSCARPAGTRDFSSAAASRLPTVLARRLFWLA